MKLASSPLSQHKHIKMYLLRTAIPKKDKVSKGLKRIYGIGNFISKIEVLSLGLTEKYAIEHLRNTHKRLLRSKFSNTPPLAARLATFYKTRCIRLIDIQSYSGRRHKFGYPVRGQRTHTNARTQKKLHRRWSLQVVNARGLKQQSFSKKNSSQKAQKVQKPKKPKVVSKAKNMNKKKAPTQKVGKYKIS